MFVASQLTEISSRFPAHVQDLREFLLKEKLPVPSPDAIPQLSSRLEADPGFRADVGSLMRTILYQEREGIGYEDLLGILVAAAAGTEHDLKSDSQETDIRGLLRFLLQSRRPTHQPDPEPEPNPEETKVAIEPEAREPVPVTAVPVDAEPVLVGALRSPAEPSKRKRRWKEASVAVAEDDRREPDDLVLPPFRTSGLFAAQMELDPPRVHSAWVVGIVCMLLGVGAGLMAHRAAEAHVGVRAAEIGPMLHRVVSAAKTRVGVRTADSSSSQAKEASPVASQESAAGESKVPVLQKNSPAAARAVDHGADTGGAGAAKTESPAGAAETASVAEGAGKAVPPGTSDQVPPAARQTIAEAGSAGPVTVVKQVVTAYPSQSLDPEDPMAAAAATKSIVQKASDGVMPANVIFSPPPTYPAAASAAGVEGEVTVKAVVDPQGKVIYTRAVSGPPLLRDAALKAVQRWRYRPQLNYGQPVAVTTVAIVDFKFAK